MVDRGHDGAERHAEDAVTDLRDNGSLSGRDSPPLKLDHCDLLLDAIDAQLGQLQVQPQKRQALSRDLDCSVAAPLKSSQSSKDTGLGSTTQTNDTPVSCLDFMQTLTMEQTSERSTDRWEDPVTQEETKQKFNRRTRDREEIECQREQVVWRLERLLGETCNEGRLAAESQPPSDSICTEDFVSRFRDEMVELTLPECNVQPLDTESERTEISDCEQSVLNVDRKGTATRRISSKDTEAAHYSQSKRPGQREDLVRRRPHSCGVNTSHSEEDEERCNTPESTEHGTPRQNKRRSPQARSLAGVPVWSFDTVSIDSDLDSVCTEQVRQHIDRRPGWRSLLQSVMDMDDYCTTQSEYDTPTQDESDPRSTSGQRSLCGNRSPSTRKAQRSKRDTCSLVCSSGDKDSDDDTSIWSRRRRPERTAEKMPSDWAKTTERLSTLRQKCETEEETLQLKRTQLKDVELSLSELQQRRNHALQEIERLTAETAKMEMEKRTVEFVLRASRTGKHLNGCQQSCVLEGRDVAEELSQTLKDGGFTERPSVVMSVLEREEMDRLLESAKTELFAEQRRAREKLESMQETLEETREELQRVTEAEIFLRSRCAYLEEKQRKKKDEIKAVELQVGGLQGELGECKIRVGTLEKMLSQKELKLLDLQETCTASQAERDGLKGELQRLETQHCSVLKEAQEHAQRVMKEEDRANTLKDQALSLTRHIESLKSLIRQKDEEIKKLKDSLEQQKQEAKKLHAKALEVSKAAEEERKKWEAEKVEAVQVHRAILEERIKARVESMRSEMQREKSEVQALKTRVQEVESERCAQQREQESLLAAVCNSLKEEHQAELQQLQSQMTQESQSAEREALRVQEMLEDKESRNKQVTAEMEQRLRYWARELGAECRHLQLLVEQSGAEQRSSVRLAPSPTAAEALTQLRAQRQQLKHVIDHLHQQLDAHQQTAEELRHDKKRELSVQRRHLRAERDQALDCLKERLIQEHIDELSSLKGAHVCDGGVTASLRKQLRTKDLELRQVQRSMCQWKEQTAARLACKFEEEFTAELERRTSKTQEEKQRKSERPEAEMTHSAKSLGCSPSPRVAASHSPSDMASYKLLRYLQSRVKQLRVENQAFTGSPSPSNSDLSGSYPAAITQDTAATRDRLQLST